MTEVQAHEFLSKCESRLLWRKVADENKVIEIINQNFRSGLFSGLFLLGSLVIQFPYLGRDGDWVAYHFGIFMFSLLSSIAVAMIGFSIWILICMHQVQKALRPGI